MFGVVGANPLSFDYLAGDIRAFFLVVGSDCLTRICRLSIFASLLPEDEVDSALIRVTVLFFEKPSGDPLELFLECIGDLEYLRFYAIGKSFVLVFIAEDDFTVPGGPLPCVSGTASRFEGDL